jgi:hypothetical protein
MAPPTYSAGSPPTVTVTGSFTVALVEGVRVPGTIAGVVVPNPVAQRMTVSPGLAGVVVTEEKRPGGPT